MKLTDRKSVKGYMKDITAEFRKGTVLEDILLNSAYDTFEQAQQCDPVFVKAAVAYIEYAQRMVLSGYTPEQEGKVQESSEERKAVLKAFTLDSVKKIDLFRPEWYISAQELFIYHLVEAVFDASLLVEQSAYRRFEEIVTLYRSFTKVEDVEGWTFGYYGNTIIFIDTCKGLVWKVTHPVVKGKIKEFGLKGIERQEINNEVYYNAVLGNGRTIPLMRNYRLVGGSWSRCKSLKDSKKNYIQVVLECRQDNGRPACQFPAHTLLLLAEYGINTIKHTIIKDGLFTCDHVDMQGTNTLLNLELTTRKDNKLRAASKDEDILSAVNSYNLFDFFKKVDSSFNDDKVDIKNKQYAMRYYWEELLQTKTAHEILTAC